MSDRSAGDELLVLNGIDLDTGDYLTPKSSVGEVAQGLREDLAGPVDAPELTRRRHDDEDHLGVRYGLDPQDLAAVGWGLVVPSGVDPTVLDALEPLLRLREEQAGGLFRRLDLLPGEGKDEFLVRHGAGPSVVDPRRVPYYLLLLGSPEHLPFDVQFQLGVSHAVGRLDLESPEVYAAYAANVLEAERGLAPNHRASSPTARRIHLFGTRHPADRPTALSAALLVEPLFEELRQTAGDWDVTADVGDDATRVRLEELLVGAAAPDVLFTATHGVDSKATHRDVAGALLCQDWPGPDAHRPIDGSQYFAGGDVPRRAAIGPRVVFSFACYGAGTDGDSDGAGILRDLRETSAAGFTSRLPQRLLGAPAGGALAFVGHVGRSLACSFLWKGLTAQVTPFQSTLLALMDGCRLGSAMESLTSRYAEIATELTLRLGEFRTYRKRIDDVDLVGLWSATEDARAYVVLGDPAIRLA